jgi:signal peptidase I
MRRSRRRWILVAILIVIVALITVSSLTGLLLTGYAKGTFSMAPTLPGCNGRHLDEDFTYRFRDPHRGEIVLFHARGSIGGTITPDPKSHQLGITKRVIGVPGDTVVGRSGRVFVNGKKADDIPTDPFNAVHLGRGQYWVLGDNRGVSEDSRAFGPVSRKAIYGRVVLVFWPLSHFGIPGYNKHLKPPGPLCGANS